ncbi:MAG: O-antigen ligase family protein [Burkholderiales bacterium]|nr:O-antigen ligase family protein [Burkholderiales bacterium]
MSESLIALSIIAAISILIFMVVKPAFAGLLPDDEFNRRRNLWLAITFIVFLSHNFWLYILLSAIAIHLTRLRECNAVALYFSLLFVMPPVWDKVPGLGFMDHLFVMNPTRLLEFAILLPTFLAISKQDDKLPFGRSPTEKLLMAYILLTLILQIRNRTLTDALREGFYAFIDVFLPYYVISRSLRDIDQFKKACSAFVLAVLLLSGAAIYEYASHQLLYSSIGESLGAKIDMSNYLMRGDSLRALATTGQPIPLGFVVMVGIGLYLFLQRYISNRFMRNLSLMLLACGSFAALSRGPWIGTAFLLIVFTSMGPNAKRNLTKLAAGCMTGVILALTLPGGEKIIDLLPFVGHVDSENVAYRERLFVNALSVIKQNPLMGSVNFLDTPEMQSMIQGQGIIDIVNSYLGIALEYGLIGLGLFAGFFLSILWGLYKPLRQFRSQQNEHYLFGAILFRARTNSLEDEHYLLGLALFAVLLAILITIYTVSSITVIPTVYWAVAGMGVAYIRMPRQIKEC